MTVEETTEKVRDEMDSYIEKIAMYMEDALSAEEVVELEAHLASCSTCQAEQATFMRIDQLFAAAPMVAPAPDFISRFEMRLERRVNRRRTWVGVSVISLILVMATGLLIWSAADSGLILLSLLSNFSLLGEAINLFNTTITGLDALFKAGLLVFKAMLHLVRHPVFWGCVVLATGIVSLWAQLLRWFNFARQPVTA